MCVRSCCCGASSRASCKYPYWGRGRAPKEGSPPFVSRRRTQARSSSILHPCVLCADGRFMGRAYRHGQGTTTGSGWLFWASTERIGGTLARSCTSAFRRCGPNCSGTAAYLIFGEVRERFGGPLLVPLGALLGLSGMSFCWRYSARAGSRPATTPQRVAWDGSAC